MASRRAADCPHALPRPNPWSTGGNQPTPLTVTLCGLFVRIAAPAKRMSATHPTWCQFGHDMKPAIELPWILKFPMALVCLLCGALPVRSSCAEREVRYNRDVLPILAENCFACHGHDKGTREAGLR